MNNCRKLLMSRTFPGDSVTMVPKVTDAPTSNAVALISVKALAAVGDAVHPSAVTLACFCLLAFCPNGFDSIMD